MHVLIDQAITGFSKSQEGGDSLRCSLECWIEILSVGISLSYQILTQILHGTQYNQEPITMPIGDNIKGKS